MFGRGLVLNDLTMFYILRVITPTLQCQRSISEEYGKRNHANPQTTEQRTRVTQTKYRVHILWDILYILRDPLGFLQHYRHGPLARYVKLRVAHALGMPGTFSPSPRVSHPDMHHGTCATHVPWCMLGSLTSGFLWSLWWGKRFRHSRRMPNPHFFVSAKRPITDPHSVRISYSMHMELRNCLSCIG